MKRVRERNEAINEIAKDLNYKVDDLYEVSIKVPFDKRAADGFHYATFGYEMFANAVVDSIKSVLP